MKFRKVMLVAGSCIVIIVLLGIFAYFFQKTKIVVLSKMPEPEQFPHRFEASVVLDLVKTPEDAVNIAKAAIQSVYGESAFLHPAYGVYLDDEAGQYVICPTEVFCTPARIL